MLKKRRRRAPFLLLVFVVFLAACGGSNTALPLRSDMPINGLTQVVTYNLRGPANKDQEVNYAELRGVNEESPRLQLRTTFGRMSGSKTQDSQFTLPDGTVVQGLGMVKTQRFAGYTSFMSVETATYTATDAGGHSFCGVKVRLDFNRNLLQRSDPNLRDYDSLWYYDVPCSLQGTTISLDLNKATLRCVVLNEVWQFRIAWGSSFFNWGHSVTIVGGALAAVQPGWWEHLDVPNSDLDAVSVAKLMSGVVADLESSEYPWLEFKKGGDLDKSGAYLIYSAADADQFWTWNNIFLNRQNEYAVFYRSDRTTPWDYIRVKPVYNYEWNDAGQVWANLKSWGSDPFKGRLNEEGLPKDEDDDIIPEMERIGWMNAPNASLEQIQFISSSDQILYVMTVRAFVGAHDSLIIFGDVKPDLAQLQAEVPQGDTISKPILYDEKGEPLDDDQQFTQEDWAKFQRESTIWNYMKDNPHSVGADLFVQYRYQDNSTWAPIPCSGDGGGTCGYDPVEWNLSTSYYLDGDVAKPWLVSQLLGEVGVRTLGMSYVSGRYQGTGMLFALGQKVLQDQFYTGFSQESVWILDARASQLPGTLAQAWTQLHS